MKKRMMPILYGSKAVKHYIPSISYKDIDEIHVEAREFHDVCVVSQEVYDNMLKVLDLTLVGCQLVPSLDNLKNIYLATCCRIRTLPTKRESLNAWKKYLDTYHKIMNNTMMDRNVDEVFDVFLAHTITITQCRDAYSMKDIENKIFFDDKVPRVIPHDQLHDKVAKFLRGSSAVELFTNFKEDGNNASLDDDRLWDGIQTNLQLVRQMIIEELIVLFIERYYIINIRSRLQHLNELEYFDDTFLTLFSHFATNLCGDGRSLLRRYVLWDASYFFTEENKTLIYNSAVEVAKTLDLDVMLLPLNLSYLEQLTITRIYSYGSVEPDETLFRGEALEALSLSRSFCTKLITHDDIFYSPFSGLIFSHDRVIGQYKFTYDYPILNVESHRIKQEVSRSIELGFSVPEEVIDRQLDGYSYDYDDVTSFYYGSHCVYLTNNDFQISLNVSVSSLDEDLPPLIIIIIKHILQEKENIPDDSVIAEINDDFNDLSLHTSRSNSLEGKTPKELAVFLFENDTYSRERLEDLKLYDCKVDLLNFRFRKRIRDKLCNHDMQSFFELHAALHSATVYPEMIEFCKRHQDDNDVTTAKTYDLAAIYLTIMNKPITGFFTIKHDYSPIIPLEGREWREVILQIDLFFEEIKNE